MKSPAATHAVSLCQLTQHLVRIPSCSGQHPQEPILTAIGAVLSESNIEYRIVRGPQGEPLAGHAIIQCGTPGPTYLLNAPADTAALGDVTAWHHEPFGAELIDGWLYGRGSADSKAGVSVFCHIASEIRRRAHELRGRLVLIFDADEHSGGFSGIRRTLEQSSIQPLAGAFIGYPGHDRIIVGCRGFHRVILRVHGIAAHSGSSQRRGVNAITRTARLIASLEHYSKSLAAGPEFPLAPAISATAIRAGEGFSTVPDLCTVNLDCRLTPHFDSCWAERQIAETIAQLDRDAPGVRPTELDTLEGWPAYQLSSNAPIVNALQQAARDVLERALPEKIAGPSSVGNYLSTLGVDATSGFGVHYRNLHAADECIEVASLEPTFRVYWEAITRLLSREPP